MRLDCIECSREVREHETDVGTKFVQMRLCYARHAKQHLPLLALSLLYTNHERVKKTGNKALQMCQHNSE